MKIKNNGITLIALVITIVIMLILVGVSLSILIDDGLFEYAGKATEETKNAINNEQEVVNDAIDNYIKPYTGEIIIGNNGEKFSAIYKNTEKNNYTDEEGKKATIPAGFSVGISDGINKISTGLVIRDENGNEFVWIPVTENLNKTYAVSSDYSEPTVLEDTWEESSLEIKPKFDSQEILTELYGDNKEFIYADNFKYKDEYEKMVNQVNEHGGFYIGRYETTIDNAGNIGSKYDEKVLTAGDTFTYNNKEYYYRWYGLYLAQKNAKVSGNGINVQTAMIYGQLWDKTMDYIRQQNKAGKTEYNVDTPKSEWHTGSGIVNAGTANPTTMDEAGNIILGDVALNIWDLESNAWEWTQEASAKNNRVYRGCGYIYPDCAFARYSGLYPTYNFTYYSSRLILYVSVSGDGSF